MDCKVIRAIVNLKTGMVVTDIEMPQLDGFDMMRCIRTINPSVKTIYMSGAPTQYRRSLTAEAQKFGAAVLRKPFVGMELLNFLLSASEKVSPMPARYESSIQYEWPGTIKYLIM